MVVIMRSLLIYLLLTVSTVAIASCGRYGAPLPPSVFAPEAVSSLQANGSDQGVRIAWVTPERDRRGKELVDLKYFAVLRTELDNLGPFIRNPLGESEVVGQINADHITKVEEKRTAARLEKRSTRNIKLAKDSKLFEFLDTTANPGASYIYSVVAYTAKDVAGGLNDFVRIDFNGSQSLARVFSVDAFNRPYSILLSTEGVVEEPSLDGSLTDFERDPGALQIDEVEEASSTSPTSTIGW
jgi:hypothetical protein